MNNSAFTFILLVLAMAVWLGGANLVVARHCGFKSGAFPFPEFNGREWAILAVLGVAGLALFALAALVMAPGSPWLKDSFRTR